MAKSIITATLIRPGKKPLTAVMQMDPAAMPKSVAETQLAFSVKTDGASAAVSIPYEVLTRLVAGVVQQREQELLVPTGILMPETKQ